MTRIPFIVLAVAGAALAQDAVRSAIVKIHATKQSANYSRPWEMYTQRDSTGSGCIIDGNRVLTNAHVVSDQTFVQVRRAGMADKYVAHVIAVCHEVDLALLGVADETFFAGARPLALGALPSVGDTVVALGFPEGGSRITVTEGVVSRIDRSYYSHSKFSNLVCQIDAAINSGSSGGPILQDGAIVGVAFQASSSGENIGYMVPAPVIRHFLADLEDGRVDGTPALPVRWQVMENAQLRGRYGMGDGQTGILLTKVPPLFEGEGKLRARDVLLRIDGAAVANDGTIEFRGGERIDVGYAVDRKQVGETLALNVLRDGRETRVVLALPAAKSDYGYLVPRLRYEKRPSYYIVGGLVFPPLVDNYYDAWNDWRDVPVHLHRYYYEVRSAGNAERDEVVVLIDVLPDELNVGYVSFEDGVVSRVNGRAIRSLRDMVDAIESHDGDSHRILLEDSESEIVLSKADLERRSAAILERYRVPADRSADLETR